ncbi:MAG: NAD-glutamate dehydrogenase domain-containing protein, partial [Planctomycetota bacterium]
TGTKPVYLTVFDISGPGNEPITGQATFERLGDIAHRVLTGRLANDALLGLGYKAGLDWKQIDLLITYRNYFAQVFRGHAARSVSDALLNQPDCARTLVRYFEAKFGHEGPKDPAARIAGPLAEIEQGFREQLDAVNVIQEDVILRLFLSLIKSTVRTNFYRSTRGEHISIKIHSSSVENMPRPCPLYEIYVHGPGVEGVHLRGGMVARGGLRHSDRPDDFRTEVHGLQKTQQVKNAVIVPVGSKGGFVTRYSFAERERQEQEVRAQYETFISGLLDITDNREGDHIVPPPGVMRYDGDDPYLVVAADKGTATFSDLANGISARYGFWLGDAFASGGSNGYDHKKIAITARGAWVNVERHFRELGINIREQSITVAGIGDMAGDVFGNGMLLNDKMKLVAAFNHRHIFIDPDPDPAKSYAERKRMFGLPRSNWTDYDKAAMSEGGAIFDRNSKAIRLSPQAQKLLGHGPEPISGPDLIRLVLMLNVDLMWFGGIGTYVKASRETHTDADDPANNNVRVDASELRCRVIGEGANLAMTKESRREFLNAGGLCNTDYIDNSAGVDCSDHEVNLKILCRRVIEHGGLKGPDERNKLLRAMENEVADHVLRNNYLQSALVTMEQMRARRDGVESMLTQLHRLQQKGVLDRRSERIPGDDELRESLTGRGVPRTVLCSLISNTKNELYQQVLASDIPDMPYFNPTLLAYFPKLAVEKFTDHILNHPLRREIIATLVTNNLVNQAGTTFLNDLATESATPLRTLLLRYVKCNELLEADALRAAIHKLDNVVAAANQYQALMEVEDTIRALVRWWDWNQDTWRLSSDAVEAMKPDFAQATSGLINGLPPAAAAALQARTDELVARGFPAALAARIAALPMMKHCFLAVAVSRQKEKPIETVAQSILAIGDALSLGDIDAILAASPRESSWENRFHSILEREAAALRRDLTLRVFSSSDADPLGALTRTHADRLRHIGDGVQAVRTMRNSQVPLFILFDEYRPLIAN